MADARIPGPEGLQFDISATAAPTPPGTSGSSFVTPGPVGSDYEPEPLDERVVTQVDKDWEPTPKPDTTPIKVTAATLADLHAALKNLKEAGQGGGRLRIDPVPPGTSSAVTVKLHGNLLNKVVEWDGYANASTAAKAHWDQVITALKRHEQRHMEIAIEEGDKLASSLIGHKIGSSPTLADKVSAANTAMQKRQDDLDSPAESDHGRKKGHAYGDCNLDPTIP